MEKNKPDKPITQEMPKPLAFDRDQIQTMFTQLLDDIDSQLDEYDAPGARAVLAGILVKLSGTLIAT